MTLQLWWLLWFTHEVVEMFDILIWPLLKVREPSQTSAESRTACGEDVRPSPASAAALSFFCP